MCVSKGELRKRKPAEVPDGPPSPVASEPPEEEFRRFREGYWSDILKGVIGMGGLPLAAMLFVPRTCLSYMIVGVAMLCRAIARCIGGSKPYDTKANLRILIVTDYMPPQTHGIAIRFRQYIDYMRKEGHEVHVFTTNFVKERESSFDHPNLPSIVNPYNIKNMMAYSAGVKLAWYLGAKTWDVVHVVSPTNICWAVLPVVAWRRIPIYISHHVEMKFYVYEYVKLKYLAHIGYFFYWLFTKWPAEMMATINAAPTLVFLNEHFDNPNMKAMRRRIPSGVAHERFLVDSPEQVQTERKSMLSRCGLAPDADVCVIVMVQRLAPEKGTHRCLEALSTLPRTRGTPLSLDGKRPLHLMVCGDGPSRSSLEKYAQQHALPVTFAGNILNAELPPLYRAADIFVTGSTSETYGLTVLEALTCGTPAVIPHCSVFDELWVGRIPDGWMYDADDPQTLLDALRQTQKGGKARLQADPIKSSWQDGTQGLLAQYREAIEANLPNRRALSTVIGAFDHLLRFVLFAACTWWLGRTYTTKMLNMGMGLLEDLRS